MTEEDKNSTLREFREYFVIGYESHHRIAARIGVSQSTIWSWLAGKRHPAAKPLARLRLISTCESPIFLASFFHAVWRMT
jgi:hypothetical protein